MPAEHGSAKSGGGGAKLDVHPLVKKMLGEDGEPTTAISLVGYVGPSKKADHVRLYTGLDFQSYYEVPRASVIDAHAVDAQDENSASKVMIKPDATLELVQTTKQSGTASFLAGGSPELSFQAQGKPGSCIRRRRFSRARPFLCSVPQENSAPQETCLAARR
jgi:hypothetical protein